MLALRDSAEAIGAYDVAVYLVSLDDPQRNADFADSLGAKHSVLSDPGKQVARAYGVLGPGGLYARRWTYYSDAAGKIAAIDREVTPESAGQDIARRLGELGFRKR